MVKIRTNVLFNFADAVEDSASKVRKRAEIRNRYNQGPHLTQDTNWKVTTSHLDTTNESQEVIPFPADDHMASINESITKTRQK